MISADPVPRLDEVAVEEALPLARGAEGVLPRRLDGHVSLDRDERRVARLVGAPAPQRAAGGGLGVDGEAKRAVPVLLREGVPRPQQELPRLRQVRVRPSVARRRLGPLDQIRRARDLGGGAVLGRPARLGANHDRGGSDDDQDEQERSPETDRPNWNDEPVQIGADRLHGRAASLKHRELLELSRSLIAQADCTVLSLGWQGPRNSNAFRPTCYIRLFQKTGSGGSLDAQNHA